MNCDEVRKDEEVWCEVIGDKRGVSKFLMLFIVIELIGMQFSLVELEVRELFLQG